MSEEKKFFYFMLMPGLIVASLYLIILIYNIVLSFYSIDFYTYESRFMFLDNYKEVISHPLFFPDLIRGFIYAGLTTFISFILALGCALLIKGRKLEILSASLILPYTLTAVATVIIWKWMYYPAYGDIGRISSIILGKTVNILGNTDTALFGISLLTSWVYTPFMFFLIYGAVRSTPRDLIDAAKIFGAGPLQIFRKVIWPHIKRIVLIAFFIRFIWNISKFDYIYLATGGGPANSTETLPIRLFIEFFGKMRIGHAATIGVVLILLHLVFLCIILYIIYGKWGV